MAIVSKTTRTYPKLTDIIASGFRKDGNLAQTVHDAMKQHWDKTHDHEDRITTAESTISSQTTTISDLQTKVADLEKKIIQALKASTS